MSETYRVWLDRVHCIAESDELSSSDEVYFAFALADKASTNHFVTWTKEGVNAGDTFNYGDHREQEEGISMGGKHASLKREWREPVLWEGPIDGPLCVHIQGWEEDNGKSPVRQEASKVLGEISQFMQRGLQKGGRPGTQRGKVAGMWDFVAGSAGLASLILDWMEDDFIGEGMIVFDKLPGFHDAYLEQRMQIGDWWTQEDIFGKKTASKEGAHDVYLRIARKDFNFSQEDFHA